MSIETLSELRRTDPGAWKAKVLGAYDGRTQVAAAKKLGLPMSTFTRWLRECGAKWRRGDYVREAATKAKRSKAAKRAAKTRKTEAGKTRQAAGKVVES